MMNCYPHMYSVHTVDQEIYVLSLEPKFKYSENRYVMVKILVDSSNAYVPILSSLVCSCRLRGADEPHVLKQLPGAGGV